MDFGKKIFHFKSSHFRTEGFESLNLDWSGVEDALKEDTQAGYNIAVIETDKVLRGYLDKLKYLGSDHDQRIKIAGALIDKGDEFTFLAALRDKILKEKNFNINREDTREIISEYWKIIKAIEEFDRRARRRQKIWLKLKNLSVWPYLKYFMISFFVLMLLANFFSRTDIGRELIKKIAEISEFLFWYIVIFLTAFAAINLTMLVADFRKNRKQS